MAVAALAAALTLLPAVAEAKPRCAGKTARVHAKKMPVEKKLRAKRKAEMSAAGTNGIAKPKTNDVAAKGKRKTPAVTLVVGTKRDDVLEVPGSGQQVIIGLGGDDVIVAAGGVDWVCGGAGNDTILPGRGNDKVLGGKGNDVVYNEKGKDKIRGEEGDDTLLGGPREDALYGGVGNDTLNGGGSRDDLTGGPGDDLLDGDDGGDELLGDDGADTILGGGGGEDMRGGPGEDRLYGELQDDSMSGDDGDDLLVGGHGIDEMYGGVGDDWIRGDTNQDRYFGDAGADTASFATAMPDEFFDGVQVNLAKGEADGPGGRDTLAEIENVLGSAFDDEIVGDGNVNELDGGPGDDALTGAGGSDRLDGGQGNDLCDADGADRSANSCGFASAAEQPPDPRPSEAYAYLDPRGPDPGLVLMGADPSLGAAQQDDNLSIASALDGFRVFARSAIGSDGAGCESQNANVVFCSAPAAPLGYIVGWGDEGDDHLRIAIGRFPATMSGDLDGGPGDDVLDGGLGADTLFSGQSGNDLLRGGLGSDALIAEGVGGDMVEGGGGNDDLATDDPCRGHIYVGGPGYDVASFARYDLAFNGRNGVTAQLGGAATDPSRGDCSPTLIRPDNEILEGSFGPDVLYGDAGNNPLILGREGDDVIHGLGGDDRLRGAEGADTLLGEDGFDILEAKAGDADRALDCGKRGGQAFRDSVDPQAISCRRSKKAPRRKTKRRKTRSRG